MKQKEFDKSVLKLMKEHEILIHKKNKREKNGNGIIDRYKNPVLTAEHTPVFWRYDLNYKSNPHLLERLGMNCTFNSGAMMFKGKYTMVVRAEGVDRKSFFAIAQSPNGIDNWSFWDYPVVLPETDKPDTNVYDMRLTEHEDGWIYGLFCTERKDPDVPEGDTSSAVAECGIARTRDLVKWERLPDLKTKGGQQRNCVLHPLFINGKYAIYTRPQDGFIDIGKGGGIGFGLTDSMENPVINKELVIENKIYHTIKEVKNGLGPGPIKTKKGWLHLAHGVRNTAAGLRYVLYMFLTDLKNPEKVIKVPGGYFMAPQGDERIGDVSNVLFSNGWIVNKKDEVFIYYGSSDTRMHVASSTVEKLLDYVLNTPEDGLRSAASVKQRSALIKKNLAILKKKK
jgi:4-O-beta-D-mannosyl-D-glucose phosphorylase